MVSSILNRKRDERGFTIVELLIVIVVIGILAAIVITSFSGVQAKARDAKRNTDMRAFSAQLEAYYNGDTNAGSYPTGLLLGATATATGALINEGTATTLLKGLDAAGLRAPGQGTSVLAVT